MRLDRIGVALVAAAGLTGLSASGAACGAGGSGGDGTASVESEVSRPVVKGGDGRAGAYQGVEGWWKPAPDHEAPLDLGASVGCRGGQPGPDHRGGVGGSECRRRGA